ncbi:RidA family protein [Diaphorobacter caeni]|uniref:RidA family protein n=1 Tax=Diaphorobacter caeni TaxID=2784387 RepID=UPI00188E504F|nr:RidA family protein [Diaphorobacter caeni]MBF5006779.1 RidA family protein [Diaphorobacter caeni]
MHERITSAHGPQPKFMYTPCIRNGALGIVSGMVALDPQTGTLIDGDVAAQTQRIFDNLHLALPDYRFGLDDLMLARIYTTRMDLFPAINQIWERQFTPTTQISPPARTSVGVSALPLGALVEIEFMFCQNGADPTTLP